jgi:hypothetical protein
VYLDEARSFGGSLDNAAIRLGVYREVLDRSVARSRLSSFGLSGVSYQPSAVSYEESEGR